MAQRNAVYYMGNRVNSGFAMGWGSLAMVNGAIAEFKGRSPVFWSFISLIGGPLCTFYLVYFATPYPVPTPVYIQHQQSPQRIQ